MAGSVRTFEQIEELRRANVWAFTVGGAIFEKRFVKQGTIRDQIVSVFQFFMDSLAILIVQVLVLC
jgi:hypothetical protein